MVYMEIWVKLLVSETPYLLVSKGFLYLVERNIQQEINGKKISAFMVNNGSYNQLLEYYIDI